MAVCARAVAEPIANRPRTVSELRLGVTGAARERSVPTFERKARSSAMVETFDPKRSGRVAAGARDDGRAERKLPRMGIFVTAFATPRNATVARPSSDPPIFGGRVVARGAGKSFVGACQRPRRVIDAWLRPPQGLMTRSASVTAHLGRKLFSVRILVALSARAPFEMKIRPRSRAGMARPARYGLMLAFEWERRLSVEIDSKESRQEAAFGVTTDAVPIDKSTSELTLVSIFVAPRTALERQRPKPLPCGTSGIVTLVAVHVAVPASEREGRSRVRLEAHRSRKSEPPNPAVARGTVSPEVRLVDGSVAGHAGGAARGRPVEPAVVALGALDAQVPARQAQARMVRPHGPELRPTTRPMAIGTGALEAAIVRVVVAIAAR